MDLRVERTRRSIINSFIELRSQKPIEKITVKELAEAAFINKATFYSHYEDIYDLTEQLENEIIEGVLKTIPYPEELISKPKETTESLVVAIFSQKEMIHILFSGSRESMLVTKLEKAVKARIYEVYPEYQNDLEKNIVLTYLIRGGFHTFMTHSNSDRLHEIIGIVGNVCEKMLG